MATDHDMDISAHQASYGRFLGQLKWASIATAIVTAFVILIIS